MIPNINTPTDVQALETIENVSPYLAYRHLRLIRINPACLNIPYELGCTEDIGVHETCKVQGLSFLACSILTFWGSLFSLACCGGASVPLGIISLATFTSGSACYGVAKESESRNHLSINERLNHFYTSLCQEGADGDEEGRVIVPHIRRLFPLFHEDLYKYMDFEQTSVCFGDQFSKQQFMQNINKCKTSIADIWKTAHELHQLDPQDFVDKWDNQYYRQYIIGDGELYHAIVDYMPNTLSDIEIVQSILHKTNEVPVEQEACSSNPEAPLSVTKKSDLPKKNYISFIVNGKKFEFECEYLKQSSYFRKFVENNSNTSFFIQLELTNEEHEILEEVLSSIQNPKPQWEAGSLYRMHETIKQFGLDSIFREKLCSTLPVSAYVDFLSLSSSMEWSGLQMDLVLCITELINQYSIKDLPSIVKEHHLVGLWQIARGYHLVKLQDLLETKFIKWYKHLIMKLMKNKFESQLTKAMERFARDAVMMEETLECLSHDEVATISYSLRDPLKSFILSTNNFKVLTLALTKTSETSLFKRIFFQLIVNIEMKGVISEAFPLEIPNEVFVILMNVPGMIT